MSRIADGEYVLATKYSDGDPGDEWAVGFLKARMTCYGRVRYNVADSDGVSFRGNGFRRAQRVSPEIGAAILAYKAEIEWSSHSLWWWKRNLGEVPK